MRLVVSLTSIKQAIRSGCWWDDRKAVRQRKSGVFFSDYHQNLLVGFRAYQAVRYTMSPDRDLSNLGFRLVGSVR